jgi:hypothetical protein
MMRAILFIVAALMLAASGIIQGAWANRWGVSTELEAAVARLERVPTNVGEWRAYDDDEPQDIGDEELARAEVLGHISRIYHHRTKGEVNMLLLCGRPGPIAAHTPDICFPGEGFKLEGDAKSVRVAQADFRMIQVVKHSLLPEHLHVFWSWSSGDGWSTPNNPRITFAGSKFLYKLYVVRRPEKPDGPVKDDPAVEFLEVLLPILNEHLSLAAQE